MKTVTPKEWLKELKSHDKNKYAIATKLRELILKDKPAIEEIKYGGLLYSNNAMYTGIFAYTNHVTLEFSEGAKLSDPKQLLSGTGKFRRNIKFTSPGDIDEKSIRSFIKKASSLSRF